MLPVSKAASEGGGQSSDPINRMKSLQWSRQAPKLPLMPQDFSMCILRQYRGFWLELVPGPCLGDGLMHFCDTPRADLRAVQPILYQPNIIRVQFNRD